MAKPRIKVVTIPYGIFDNPNNKAIDKAVKKWEKQGYRLEHLNNKDVGCLAQLMTLGWARGKSELTFILNDE